MNSLLVTESRPSAATLPQNPRKRWKPRTSQIKYGLFFAMILMMITAVKVYLNYANIQQNITDVKAKIIQRQKDIQYLAIQNAYYHSEYVSKITAHQEGILLANEQFILFEHIDPNAVIVTQSGTLHSGTLQQNGTGTSLSPRSSRRDYFDKKFDRVP